MSSSRSPLDWFDTADGEETEPRSDLRPPGPPVYLRLRTLSHCRETVHLANRMNLYRDLPDQMKHDFLLHSGGLDERRTTGWGRRPRENEADLALVMEYYNLSRSKARQALITLRPDHIEVLQDWMSRGGR